MSNTTARIVALTLVVGTPMLAVPAEAAAGSYEVHNCNAASGSFSTQAFGVFVTRGMRLRRACNPEGPGRRGLLVGNVLRKGRVEYKSRSILTLNAPPFTHFKRYSWSGRVRRRDCAYAIQVYATGAVVGRKDIRNRQPFRECPTRGRAQISGNPRLRHYPVGSDEVGASRIVHRVDCRSKRGCQSRGENFVQTFKATVEVVDHTPPSVQITGGSLASGRWLAGEQPVEYTASDNVGVESAVGLVGVVQAGDHQRPCDHTRLVPCPNGPGALTVRTGGLPDGTQSLAVAAQDSAHNVGRSQDLLTHIDNTPPPRVDVAVEGGEGWRRTPDFDLVWANPFEADRAPIAAAHHSLCRAGTQECAAGSARGEGIGRVRLTAPAPGEHTAVVWREDAAGNQESDNASVPVTLRYDPEPPQPAFEPLAAADPTRVSVAVVDRVSGLAGGAIEISRAGSGSWQALATERQGDRLVARIDDARLARGDYALRARAVDQAGNEGSTDRRVDGQPMVIKVPLRVRSVMRAGFVRRRTVRRTVRRGGRRRVVRRRVRTLDATRHVRFGRRVRIAGRLTDGEGRGVAGARVEVFSRTRTGAEAPAGAVTTDRRGRYRYPTRAGSSRTLRFAYAGTALVLPSQREVELLVPAASSIRVRPRRVVNGRAVTFRGRLGAPAPGKLVELQVRLSGRFQTFRTTRTGERGGWNVGYRFRRSCGRTRFEFRARLPREAGYPFEAGRSRRVTVAVRGRPCAG